MILTTRNGFDLRGLRILITGAQGGIGLACARVFATLECELVLTDVRPMDAIVDEVSRNGVKAAVVIADLSSAEGMARLAAASGDIDAFIALAGIFPIDDWMIDQNWEKTFEDVIRVNVLGTLRLVRHYLPLMAQKRRGRAVLIGSTAGRNGGAPEYVQPHYAVSKGGIHSLVFNLARKYGPLGIAVNGVAPGAIDTAMNDNLPRNPTSLPFGRLGTPEEVAWPIAFLCSPGANYLSGAILDVNGGMFVG